MAPGLDQLVERLRRPSRIDSSRFSVTRMAEWLIQEARRRSSITYGEAKRRLETEIGFDTIFPLQMGIPAGQLMNRILAVRPDCLLLNVLLVAQRDRMPSDGAGSYMAAYLGDRRLRASGYRTRHRNRWRAAFETIAADVYAFDEWEQVYLESFGQPLSVLAIPEGHEEDGISHGRQGEGPNHKKLRLWVKKHPGEIKRRYQGFRTEKEVVLDSADRVDVVFYGRKDTIAIEVKSKDSDETNLRRGVFQCIKYRAVMEAMDVRSEASLTAVLVTQEPLPGDLAVLARLNGVRHFLAPAL